MSAEFQTVMNGASRNNLTIYISKPKEIVFRRPHFRSVDIQPSFTDIVKFDEVKLLGVIFTKLTFNKHVNDTLLLCNQRFCLLKLLRDQLRHAARGLNHSLTCSCCQSYCLLFNCVGRFLSVEDENRINVFFQRAKRYGFNDTVYNVAGLREHSDRTLFKSLQIEGRCLASILPPVRSNIGELRNRGHIFTLSKCSTVAYKISYLPRCLFNFI
jgi:hypothetical protein